MTQRKAEQTVDGAVGLLLIVQLLTCFVAIAMLSRLRPPLSTAVVESTQDCVLVEQQLSRLLRFAHTPVPALAAEYVKAADELRHNTMFGQSEARLLIIQDATLVLAGDVAAVERSVRALEQVSDGARKRLRGAEQSLAFQSRAAAWVLVFFGGTLIVFASIARGWLTRILVLPLGELARVIAARARGDASVRAAPISQGALATSLAELNHLLDAMERLEAKAQENAASRALAAVLDKRGDASVIVAQNKQIIAMSQRALTLLSSDDGALYRSSLDSVFDEEGSNVCLAIEWLGTEHRLCVLRACGKE